VRALDSRGNIGDGQLEAHGRRATLVMKDDADRAVDGEATEHEPLLDPTAGRDARNCHWKSAAKKAAARSSSATRTQSCDMRPSRLSLDSGLDAILVTSIRRSRVAPSRVQHGQ
jgi:hypothetical protein